jgi:DNA-binding transcriptional MerR regulator
MATAATPPDRVPIPDRLYFRIGDVCRLSGVKAHVLRYWEAEFPKLHPKKSGTNQRLYRRKEVELVLEIKRLLYDQKYTLEGAREYLERDREKAKRTPRPTPVEKLPAQASLFGGNPEWVEQAQQVRSELADLLTLLK